MPRYPLPKHLAALVKEGVLTRGEANAAAQAERARASAVARRNQDMARRSAEWKARQEETRRMAGTWARFVVSHAPALGDLVIDGYPLREAVSLVKEWTGCDLGCAHEEQKHVRVGDLLASLKENDEESEE